MTVHEAIRARRSVRKYQPGREIPQEHIDRLLEAASSAPAASPRPPITLCSSTVKMRG